MPRRRRWDGGGSAIPDAMQTAHVEHGLRDDRNPRILIVDDDDALREIYADSLTGSGYDVRSARDGASALRVLEDGFTPCLMFLDLRMPGMDGWELARRIRADERWRDMRIVVVAAHFRIDREAADIGASAWLQKPFDLTRLEHHARRLCGS
jgi:CheY-like chemotaxis protein